MRLAGFFWLVMGWVIILAALALLQGAGQAVFLLTGLGVEVAGLVQVVRSHILPPGERT